MKKSLQVSILNQTFSIETDAAEEHVDRVSRYVDEKIKEVQGQTRTASSLNVALLACLNLADEFFRFKKTIKDQQRTAEQKIEALLEIVDLQL